MAKLTLNTIQDVQNHSSLNPDEVVLPITIDINVTCEQLEKAFVASDLHEMSVLAINNDNHEFLWEEDGNYGSNAFYLSLNDKSELCADCGGNPSMEWYSDEYLEVNGIASN